MTDETPGGTNVTTPFPITLPEATKCLCFCRTVNRRPKRTPIGVQKGPPSSSSITGMTGALFALVAA